MKDKILRMPVIVPGLTCQYGSKTHPVRGKYVYSLGGSPWRCWDCLREQIREVNAFRRRQEAEDNSPARQEPSIQ